MSEGQKSGVKNEMSYDPKTYWEHRLGSCFNLRGVGHMGFGEFLQRLALPQKEALHRIIFREFVPHGKACS